MEVLDSFNLSSKNIEEIRRWPSLAALCSVTSLLSVLWIPCSHAVFCWFPLRALCFPSVSSFPKFRVFWCIFSLFPISESYDWVFLLNWKYVACGVVSRVLDVLVFWFFSMETGTCGLIKEWFLSQKTQPLSRHPYCLMYRFCRSGCLNDIPKVLT